MERSLDEQFRELRLSVDDEIAKARNSVITEFLRAVSRMRAASTDEQWHEAVLESGRTFATEPGALQLLGSLAAMTAPVPAPPVRTEAQGNAAAQRFARVKIAELQLYQAEAVRTGRAARDLYGSLRHEIDQAREAYSERFLVNGETADFLHAEMLHALAHDDATLMGPGYPGPLA